MNDPREHKLQKSGNLGSAQIARATVIVIAVVGAAWLMIELTQLLLLVFASIIIAAIFDVLAGGIRRATGIGQNFALSISVFSLILLFVGAFALFGTQIAGEFATLQKTLPTALKGFEEVLDRYGLGDQARNLISSGSNDASELVSRAGGYAIAAGSGLADFVLVLVVRFSWQATPTCIVEDCYCCCLQRLKCLLEKHWTKQGTALMDGCWAKPFRRWWLAL